MVNAGLSFKSLNQKIEGGLFYNVQGPNLSIVGINNRPDIYTSPFNSLNLNLIYKLNDKSQISFTAKNILNNKKEMITDTYGIDSQVYSSYSPGQSFGIKWSYILF